MQIVTAIATIIITKSTSILNALQATNHET